MYVMRRTTVYLPDELKAQLERTALEQGKSEAEVVRSAIADATAACAHPRPDLPLFDSGDPALAEGVDDALAAGFGEVILLDTSGLLAAIDRAQHTHQHAARAVTGATRPLLPCSPFVLAELDYLLATRVGEAARTRLLGEVARGAYDLAPFDSRDVRAASTIIQRYADLRGSASPMHRSPF